MAAEEEKQETKNTSKSGPFGTGPVDSLVYRDSGISPELRPAAAYIPAAKRLVVREAPPVQAEPRRYSDWVPGPAESSGSIQERPVAKAIPWSRVITTLVMLTAPILLLTLTFMVAKQATSGPVPNQVLSSMSAPEMPMPQTGSSQP